MPGASNKNGRPWQKLRTLKKAQSFVDLHFVCLNNFQFVGCRKFFFPPLQYSFFPPILPLLGLCCPGRKRYIPHPSFAPGGVYSRKTWTNNINFQYYTAVWRLKHLRLLFIQGDSVARGSKLLSIKNYVIEIMIWKFIYTYRDRCKTGPAHNRCWNWSPFTSKHTWMRFSKFWNTFPKVSTLTAWVSWRIASLSCSIVRGVFFVHFALQ